MSGAARQKAEAIVNRPDLTDIETGENATFNRIVEAAYHCFERFGIKKTTMEDIATIANVARPTVYTYFAGKEDIVSHLCMLETMKVKTELKSRMKRMKKVEDTLTESLLLITRIARGNPYIRMFVETVDQPSKSADPKTRAHRINRQAWGNFIDLAVEHGELAKDLTVDAVTSWLALSQMILLIKVDAVEFTDDELRNFIRRFIVQPIVTQPSKPKPAKRIRP